MTVATLRFLRSWVVPLCLGWLGCDSGSHARVHLVGWTPSVQSLRVRVSLGGRQGKIENIPLLKDANFNIELPRDGAGALVVDAIGNDAGGTAQVSGTASLSLPASPNQSPELTLRLCALDGCTNNAWRPGCTSTGAPFSLPGIALTKISGNRADNVWVATSQGFLIHFDGSSWNPVGTINNLPIQALWVSYNDEVWIGGRGYISKYIPSRHEWFDFPKTPVVMQDIYDLVVDSDGVVWSSGASGSCGRYDDPVTSARKTGWSVTGISGSTLYPATWAGGSGKAWVAGAGGQFRSYVTDMSWGTISPVPAVTLYDIWGTVDGVLWAVGDQNTIVQSDSRTGTTAMSWPLNTTSPVNLRGIWGTAADNIWVVGSAGTIAHYGAGSSWTATTSCRNGANLTAIWGSSAYDIWTVGDNGTILRYIP